MIDLNIYFIPNLLIFYFNPQYPNNDTIILLLACRTALNTQFFNLQFYSLHNFNESEVITGNVTDSCLYHLILTFFIMQLKLLRSLNTKRKLHVIITTLLRRTLLKMFQRINIIIVQLPTFVLYL